MYRIRKGLNLPLAGAPSTDVEPGRPVKHVGLLGDDYVGMKPTMLVREGERVKLGQPLFTDKKNSGVQYTSPGAGTVARIVRGDKRKFESVSVELDGDEEETFAQYDAGDLARLDRAQVQENLVASGLWTALRTRPYSRTPELDTTPHSIFVTAIESRPHAPDPVPVIREREADFLNGLKALAQLTDGPVQLCRRAGETFSVGEATPRDFDGPHPSGLPGTHIHLVAPVSENRTVWYVGYQDVIAIGHLFTTGRLDTSRVIAFSGPIVKKPRLLRTRLGACINELAEGELEEGPARLISGSVLDGRTVDADRDFLGRFHNQVSAISDDVPQPLLGWLAPGSDKFSVTRAFTSALSKAAQTFKFTTATSGDPRPIIPIGVYEQVLPLDMEPVPLLKALAIEDAERAQALGALELDEEDLALCSFVCPGKSSFGPNLRSILTTIEKEG